MEGHHWQTVVQTALENVQVNKALMEADAIWLCDSTAKVTIGQS